MKGRVGLFVLALAVLKASMVHAFFTGQTLSSLKSLRSFQNAMNANSVNIGNILYPPPIEDPHSFEADDREVQPQSLQSSLDNLLSNAKVSGINGNAIPAQLVLTYLSNGEVARLGMMENNR